jgi:hypothetical protein
MTYRIVDTDNFGGDYPDEKFVGPEFDVREEAEQEAAVLNGDPVPYASRYYKVVEMPYKLQPGFEP